MTITEKYHALVNEVLDTFKEFAKGGVDFVEKSLPEFDPESESEIRAIIESKDLRNLSDYDFQEYLPKVYYNGRNGEETEAYVLSITEENGLLVFKADDFTKVFYIGFNDINALWSKIELLDCMS
jgi:hypothetical protein